MIETGDRILLTNSLNMKSDSIKFIRNVKIKILFLICQKSWTVIIWRDVATPCTMWQQDQIWNQSVLVQVPKLLSFTKCLALFDTFLEIIFSLCYINTAMLFWIGFTEWFCWRKNKASANILSHAPLHYSEHLPTSLLSSPYPAIEMGKWRSLVYFVTCEMR